MREPMNRSTTTIRSISSRYGASFGFGRGGRWYFGGPSRLSAKRTVLRATPSSAAIALMDLPCACKYRIVVHPSTVSISFRVLLGAVAPRAMLPPRGVSFQATRGSGFRRRQHAQERPGLRVPQAHGFVEPTTGQCLAVGREGQRLDGLGMAAQRAQERPGLRVQ